MVIRPSQEHSEQPAPNRSTRLKNGIRKYRTSGVLVAAGLVALGVTVAPGGGEAAVADVRAKPVAAPKTGPASPVQVNQVGYLPDGPKHGTFVSSSKQKLPWTLKDADGKTVAKGTTKPAGYDKSAGQSVHTIDFSHVKDKGEGYTVTVNGKKSEPFDIGDDLYSSLRTDSLAYFYHNRSGIEIDKDLVGKDYARPAGHAKADKNVPCQKGTCDYTLDVRKGWYDAGDHGKYVVNGGISVAQMMSSYERTLNNKGADGKPLGDSKLRLPEHGNDVPDILDEARWEMEFLMDMQVPKGEKLAGMAHHKMHDKAWTDIPTMPHQDKQQRELHAPSTAATLNLAASAAQAARLFEPYDKEFAAEALQTARTAYKAAKAHPNMHASPMDTMGGGAYSDGDVKDEFYWAGAELFITTGEDSYRKDVVGSKLHGDAKTVFPKTGMNWSSTAGLGALDLATAPNKLSKKQLADVRSMVTKAADGYAKDAKSAKYGVPYAPDGGGYAWGSNGQVLNNMVVLATAHDLTGKDRYRDTVLQGMDYLLGRNPLGQSYVSGYGERYSHNQHHRFWANQVDAKKPNPAPGAVAGGPNSNLEDPVAQKKLKGCAPAKCYVDDIESFATNEITVNWNAPLAWIASYVDDQGSRK